MLISNVWCFLYQFFSGENKVKITPKVNNAHTLLYVLLKSRCLPTCQKKERASKVGKRTMGTMPIKPMYNSKFSWLFRGEVCVHRNASKTSTFLWHVADKRARNRAIVISLPKLFFLQESDKRLRFL